MAKGAKIAFRYPILIKINSNRQKLSSLSVRFNIGSGLVDVRLDDVAGQGVLDGAYEGGREHVVAGRLRVQVAGLQYLSVKPSMLAFVGCYFLDRLFIVQRWVAFQGVIV